MRISVFSKRAAVAMAVPLLVATVAQAAPVPGMPTRKCAGAIQNSTRVLVNTLQNQIRLSVGKNLAALSPLCNGNLTCHGGTEHGTVCTTNGDCSGGECGPDMSKGIVGAIVKAKRALVKTIGLKCTPADLTQLGISDDRCPVNGDGVADFDAERVATCILQSVLGDLSSGGIDDAAGGILGRVAPLSVSYILPPARLCSIDLGALLQFGSGATTSRQASDPGPVQLMTVSNCSFDVCDLEGRGIVGNQAYPPRQSIVGSISTCIVSRARASSNTTPIAGTINLNTGEQSVTAPLELFLHVGTTCPVCDATTKLCDSGPNAGGKCSNAGSTDIACPPTGPPTGSVYVDETASTDAQSLDVPPTGVDVLNLSGAFCGSCDADPRVACRSDSDCAAVGCGGYGCCEFNTIAGALGDSTATEVRSTGSPQAYLPLMAGIACMGSTGSNVADAFVGGIPGPARSVKRRLNVFGY